MNLFDLQGRKALVTGATRGLVWGGANGEDKREASPARTPQPLR